MSNEQAIHQWRVGPGYTREALCGTPDPVHGYYSMPEIVTCAECLTQLQAGYDQVVRDYFEPAVPAPESAPEPAPAPVVTGDALLQVESDDPVIDLVTIDGQAVDPNSLFIPEERRPLTVEALQRVGITMPEGKASSNEITRHIENQRQNYGLYSKDQLIEELCRRDENEIRRGQEAYDGRMAGRLLREFVRGILHTADKADLDAIEKHTKDGAPIENILKLLGAEPANARQLKLEGSTVGDVLSGGRTPEEAIQAPAVPTTPRPDVAEQIRSNPNRPIQASSQEIYDADNER